MHPGPDPAARTQRAAFVVAVVAVVALAAAVHVLATARPAGAHAELVSTDPAGGSTTRTLPRAATLVFSEPVRTPVFVRVTGADGTDLATGEARIVDAEVTQPLTAAPQAGHYTMAYRITSADGHAITGTVRFRLAAAGGGARGTGQAAEPTGPGTPAAGAASGGSGGIGTGQLLLLLVVFAAGLAALGVGTARALRHSTAMVKGREKGRASHR